MSPLGKFGGSVSIRKEFRRSSGGGTPATSGLMEQARKEREFGEEFQSQIPLSFIASFQRVSSVASGDQTITGVPFRPRSVHFLTNLTTGPRCAWGFDSEEFSKCVVTPSEADTAGRYEFESGDEESLFYVESNVNRYSGGITAFNDDGFTITWTKTGSPTNTMDILYMAFR